MKAQESKLQKLIEGTNQYLVPLFQRPYSWTSREWDQLWIDVSDLMQTDGEHFIGPIVTAPARSVPEGVAKYLLIDGQQRLTTLFILLSAMRDRANALKLPELGQEIDETLLRNRFKQKNEHYKLLPTQADRASFFAVIAGESAGEDAVAKCYRFFSRKLKDFDSQQLERCKGVVTARLILVSIVLDEGDDPHVIFESLNSKGRDLTQADLIRNYFLMRVPTDEQENLFSRFWEPMQQRLGEDTTEFIRHFLMIEGAHVGKNAVYWSLKKSADREKSYQQVVAYLARLETYSRYYEAITAPDLAEKNVQLRQRFQRLLRIELTVAYPLVMALYARYSDGGLSLQGFASALDLIENFTIRRWVCSVATGELARFFPGVFPAAIGHGDLVEGIRRALAARRYPRDAQFVERLRNGRLYDRIPRVKLFLERLEEFYGHKEPASFERATIEHVMPQTLTESWRAMLGDDADEDHEDWLHTLGNLTLTAYNSELSNSDFAVKQRLLADSHLELNRYFANVSTWNRTEIERRGEKLVDVALQVWPNFAGDQTDASRNPGQVTGRKPIIVHVGAKSIPVRKWTEVIAATLRSLAEDDDDFCDWLLARFPGYCRKEKASLHSGVEIRPGVFFESHGSAEALKKRCLDVIRERELDIEWSVELA